jgi:molecular chaperone DnaJ
MGHAGYQQQGMGGHGSMNMDDIFSSFGDIFGDMFGAGGRRQQKRGAPEPQRGHDLSKEIQITLKEAFLGTKAEIAYYHFATCDTCKAKGTQSGTSYKACATCHGSGQMQFRQGFFMYSQACSACNGNGYTIPSPCTQCKGQSRSQKYDKFTVNIPAGIYDGAELRISQKGDAGVYGGPSGDLFIKVQIMPDKQFKRSGDDLVCTLSLTYPQLVLGAHIDITSIDDSKETIKIPKACPVDEHIIVSGKGFHKLRGTARGNLVVITKCHIPKKLSTEAKKLLTDYSKIIGTDTESNGSIASFFKKFLG